MSTKEFEQADAEVMELVNDHAAPEAIQMADAIKAGEIINPRKSKVAKLTRKLILKVIVCAMVAVLFLVALLLPAWVPVLCYTGMAVCLIIGSIQLDRYFGR